MVLKKVYILDSVLVETLKMSVSETAENLDMKIELETSSDRLVRILPRGYDIYILHLSNLEDQDLKGLREEQPWSYIVGISGIYSLPKELKKCLDNTYRVLHQIDIENILKRVGENN